MKRKKLTTYDYLACKGKRQLSNLFVHSEDEAAAAEEAGIDFIVAAQIIKNEKSKKIQNPKFSIFEKISFLFRKSKFSKSKIFKIKKYFSFRFFLHQSMHLYYPKNAFRASGHVSGRRQ